MASQLDRDPPCNSECPARIGDTLGSLSRTIAEIEEHLADLTDALSPMLLPRTVKISPSPDVDGPEVSDLHLHVCESNRRLVGVLNGMRELLHLVDL